MVGDFGVAMATMRAPACADAGLAVRGVRIERSTLWGSTTRGSVKLLDHQTETATTRRRALGNVRAPVVRADMSGSAADGLPPMPLSHRIKAASVSAFQEFQNARANRESLTFSVWMIGGF